MKYEFERKPWEYGLLSIRFRLNCWFLRHIGIVAFGVLAALTGVLLTVLVYEWFLIK
jgi:hypothetical protein